MNQKLGLEDALTIAMDAEIKARDFYARAAAEVQDPAGRDLLGRLASFEQYHYDKLFDLAQSLHEDGAFVEYESRTLEQFVPWDGSGEAASASLAESGDIANVLSLAIENEKTAGERYRSLAEDTADPKGHAMFRDLAREEATHQRVLEDEFYSISNQGSWGWSGMYGE
jgi:rubrerythrin